MNLRFVVPFPAILLVACLLPASAQFVAHSTRMELINGRPYVDVVINHRGPFRFMVDTGTSADVILSPAIADMLHLPHAGHLVLHDPTGLPGPTVPVRLIDTLTVAGIDFYEIHAAEHSLLSSIDVPCDGLLGFRLFDGLLLTLDYPNRRVILQDGELQPDGGKTVQAFQTREGLPFITLKVGDLLVDGLVDSGGAGLGIPDRYAKQLGIAGDSNVMGTERTLTAIFPFRVAQLASNVEFGNIAYVKPWVEINSTFQYANIGSEPLRYFSVTFDQDDNLIRFDGPRKRIALGITPAPLTASGMKLELAAPAGLTPVE